MKGVPFLPKWYMKGLGVGPRGGASRVKLSFFLSFFLKYPPRDLGAKIDKQGRPASDIRARLGKARVAFNKLYKVWKSS